MQEFKEYKAEKDFKISESLSGSGRASAVNKFKDLHDMAERAILDEFDKNSSHDDAKQAAEAMKAGIEKALDEIGLKENIKLDIPLFSEFKGSKVGNISYLNEAENEEVDRWIDVCDSEYGGNLLDEGFLSKLVGGTAGFLVGPAIGKIIARALGIEKGILYDMFTSRLVSTALGAAIADAYSKKD